MIERENEKLNGCRDKLDRIRKVRSEVKDEMETKQAELLKLVESRSSINGQIQKYKTLK